MIILSYALTNCKIEVSCIFIVCNPISSLVYVILFVTSEN